MAFLGPALAAIGGGSAVAGGISVGVGLLGAGMTAYSQIQQGKAADKAAQFQANEEQSAAQIAGQQALREQEQAAREVEQLRDTRLRAAGQNIAAASASGLTISGSVVESINDTSLQVEKDIAMAKYRGDVGAWNYSNNARSLMTQSRFTRAGGATARKNSAWSALGTVVRGASNIAGSYANARLTTA